MANFIEQAIEKMVRDGIITESELQARIAEERVKSPVNDLNNIGFVEALQMEMIDQLGQMVGELMMKVVELEGKVNA